MKPGIRRFVAAALLCLSSGTACPETSFGSWSAGVAADGSNLYAATINDSGSLLGQYCYIESGNCAWVLAMSSSCDLNDEYLLLANANSASSMKVTCKGKYENLYTYVFSDFDAIDLLVRSSKKIGLAFPLQEDQFRVVRFKLDGSGKALDLMIKGAMKAFDKATKNTTKDLDM